MKTGYEYLLDYFPEYDYRRPNQPERLDYSRPDNITEYQQRTFNVWWAIQQCGKTGNVGLEIGSGGKHTPWCLSTDLYSTDSHPIYGSACHPHMIVDGAKTLPFKSEIFSLVLANHVVEHLEGDTKKILREWLRVLKPNGVIAAVLPDQQYNDVLAIDRDHKHAWTANEFLNDIIKPLQDSVIIEEFDTLQNKFSYEIVLRKR